MDITAERSKRHRSSSPSASSSAEDSSSERAHSPHPKFHRASPSSSTATYICHLPPTCHLPGKSTAHTSESDLERHHLQFHNHICHVPVRDHDVGGRRAYTRSNARNQAEGSSLPGAFVSGGGQHRMRECGKVFPDERFLELHYTEVHDSIARQKQSNGEKIEVLDSDDSAEPPQVNAPSIVMPGYFASIKLNHSEYPVDYFFAITNHGLNKIVAEEGPAASLIRPRKDPPLASEQKGSTHAAKQRTPPEEDGPSAPAQSPPSGAMEVDEVDKLAGKLDSTLALAFVPAAVRRKGRGLGDEGMKGG